MIDANEALRLGLANRVTDPENLLGETKKYCKHHQQAPLAIAEAIALVNHAAYGKAEGLKKEVEAFGKLFDTADARKEQKLFSKSAKQISQANKN